MNFRGTQFNPSTGIYPLKEHNLKLINYPNNSS